MPAGGTWTVQNKQRPGAYINFVAVPKPVGAIGDRGVMTACLPMTWGPTGQLITLYGEDLLNGKSLAKVGCTASDADESLPYRLALAGSYKALLFRADTGGTKATNVISPGVLTVEAKYEGTTGNNISVVITADKPQAGQYTVDILYKLIQRESFVVSELADFNDIESKWVDFIVPSSPSSTEIPVTTGAVLSGGTNGTVDGETIYPAYFSAIEGEQWQCMAINTSEPIGPQVTDFIRLLRDTRGKKVQAVVYNYPEADYEGIISVDQGFKTAQDTVTVDLFPLYVASITAGANVNESNTARVIQDAISIINPIAEEDIEDALKAGKFLLSYRQDGAVCVEKDINSLHSFTVDKNYAFSKNRVVRCLDEIGNTTALIFNRNYCGKVDNDDVGRNLYKTELISMMDQLQSIGAIQNFEGTSDITVLPGSDVDSVVVDLLVQPVDSMEKLYMTVNVDA
jgi:hypothetical protein